jgi:hypothetical protein
MIGKQEIKVKNSTLADDLSISTQKILSLFKINSYSKDFSVKFNASNYVYIQEAQIPDCLDITRMSINRNLCFIFEKLEMERKQRKNALNK